LKESIRQGGTPVTFAGFPSRPASVFPGQSQFSDDSQTLPNHRHAVKDYFPIFLARRLCFRATNRAQSQASRFRYRFGILPRAVAVRSPRGTGICPP
jgi:hypothetical protein